MRRLALVFLVFLGCLGQAGFSFGETELSVTTDKKAYASGDVVVIVLKNNSAGDIFSHLGSQTPVFAIDGVERKGAGERWDRLFAWCQYPHCVYDMDGPAELKAGESVSWGWDPWIYIDGTAQKVRARTGTYRLLILYRAGADHPAEPGQWLRAVSNEFILE